VLSGLKDEDIVDKARFVLAVNRILKLSRHRIKADNKLALLRLAKPKGNPSGYIQFAFSTGVTMGRLGRSALTVVPIDEEFKGP